MKHLWKSKNKYRLNGVYGHVVELEVCYAIESPIHTGGYFMIELEKGIEIRNAEGSLLTQGRPKLFNAPTKMYGITLPEHLWRKIKKPYSVALAELLEGKK
jgi:hypothetical protein